MGQNGILSRSCYYWLLFFLQSSHPLSLHRHALREVPRLVHVPPQRHRGMVREELEEDRRGQDCRDSIPVRKGTRTSAMSWSSCDPPSPMTTRGTPLAFISRMLDTIAGKDSPGGQSATTGVPCERRANGPCLISPAAYPSAWIYVISFIFSAPSSARGKNGPLPTKKSEEASLQSSTAGDRSCSSPSPIASCPERIEERRRPPLSTSAM